jgi:osmoprotectant transport system permease protein
MSGGLAATADPWVRWDWVSRHTHTITGALRQHMVLTGVSVAVGLLVSIPLGVIAWRWRRWQQPIFAVAGILYTIPAIALFALLVPITHLTARTVEIGLVLYSLLIMIRNVVAGLDAVPDDVREAARGMGFTPMRQLLRVELPLALPAIVAGVRIATVSTIGLVTIGALIGTGGLGQLVYQGLIQEFRTPLVVGAVLSVALAATADVALLGVQRLLTPWARSS